MNTPTHSCARPTIRLGRALAPALAFCVIAIGVPASATAAETCPNEAIREAQGSTALPDCRAYELVSPPEKIGADVIADSGRTRAASDGSAASFTSLGAFGDVVGTGIANEYMSLRSGNPDPGDSGWSTHAITPAQEPLTLGAAVLQQDPMWVWEFSPDLSTGIFQAYSPLTAEDPNVVNVRNLYRRTDLRTPGAGRYQLLTRCPACGSPFAPPVAFQLITELPRVMGASADYSHVLFDSTLALTADAHAGVPNVYEWVNGVVRLAGILPDSACGSPPCPAPVSVAASPSVSPVIPPLHAISEDGSRISFSDVSTGNGQNTGTLYQRIGGAQTVPISASEKTVPDTPQPATYQTASTDGTRVFFMSAEQLTNDDTNGSIDLYMWDASKPVGARLTRISVDNNPVDPPNDAQGVFGASADGHYIYFVAAGQLVAGKPDLSGGRLGIYVWHDGSVAYIGRMANAASDTTANLLPGPTQVIRSRVTPDGKHLLFVSHSGEGLLSAHGGTDYDQTHCSASACAEFYLYDAVSGQLVCASCRPDGQPATTDADNFAHEGTGAAADNLSHVGHSLSDDGRFVFFHTTEALVSADTNGRSDVYEYDSQTGAVHLISSGLDTGDSFFLDASSDGSNVFFLTRQQLVGWDVDQNYDLYDARSGGGFPNPPSPAPACAGDSCRAQQAPAPSAATPASAVLAGPGNAPPPVLQKPAVKAPTKAQRLSRALKACKKTKPKRARRRCESQARKRFGKKASKASRSR